MQGYNPTLQERPCLPALDGIAVNEGSLKRKLAFRKSIILGILLMAGLAVASFVILKGVFIYVPGEVQDRIVTVTSSLGGVVTDVRVTPFQPIEPGQLLAHVQVIQDQLVLDFLETEIDALEAMIKRKEKGLEFSDIRRQILHIAQEKNSLEAEYAVLNQRREERQLRLTIARDATKQAKLLFELMAGTKSGWEEQAIRESIAHSQLKEIDGQIEQWQSKLRGLNEEESLLNEKWSYVQHQGQLGNELDSLRLRYSEKIHRRESLKQRLEQGKVFAIKHGKVSAILVSQQNYVHPGQPLMKITENDQPYIKAFVDINKVQQLAIGQKVTVLASGVSWPGEIFEFSEESSLLPPTLRSRLNAFRRYVVCGIHLDDEDDIPPILKKNGVPVKVRFPRWRM